MRASTTTAWGRAWPSRVASSAGASDASSGTATRPARAAPNKAMKNSGVLVFASPSRSPGAAPRARSPLANAEAARSSSA